MATTSFRYIVRDLDPAVAFYCDLLGFQEVMRPAPTFAMLVRDELRLLLSVPGAGPGGGGASMPDGTAPEPGGWNRVVLEIDELDATVEALRARGATFRNPVIDGVGGRQTLVEDPSGNPVELFQPTLPEARLGST
jgi:catechol 2,3-dioxygenase-like lactoylglutathione lyase family enzyme